MGKPLLSLAVGLRVMGDRLPPWNCSLQVLCFQCIHPVGSPFQLVLWVWWTSLFFSLRITSLWSSVWLSVSGIYGKTGKQSLQFWTFSPRSHWDTNITPWVRKRISFKTQLTVQVLSEREFIWPWRKDELWAFWKACHISLQTQGHCLHHQTEKVGPTLVDLWGFSKGKVWELQSLMGD